LLSSRTPIRKIVKKPLRSLGKPMSLAVLRKLLIAVRDSSYKRRRMLVRSSLKKRLNS